MAKNTKMAAESEEAKAAAHAEAMAARTYVLKDNDWDRADGQEYGGQSEILLMDVGEIAGKFTYVGKQAMATELGDTTVHTAVTANKEQVRLPISAAFLRSVDQAGIRQGDKFLIKRLDDVQKKSGKGKGQTMQIYAVKVTDRAPREQAPGSPF